MSSFQQSKQQLHDNATFSAQGHVAYHGVVHEGIGDALLAWSEELLRSKVWPTQSHKRAVRCMVELIQNLSKHGGEGAYECCFEPSGAMRIGSFNVVNPHQREVIEKAIEQAFQPPMQELRASRLEKLVEGERTSGGGAGLGFIDLRACSEGHVRSEFIPCDATGETTFALHVWIHP